MRFNMPTLREMRRIEKIGYKIERVLSPSSQQYQDLSRTEGNETCNPLHASKNLDCRETRAS